MNGHDAESKVLISNQNRLEKKNLSLLLMLRIKQNTVRPFLSRVTDLPTNFDIIFLIGFNLRL